MAGTPWFRMGMCVCYDVRFAGLYQQLTDAGATLLSVPAAFTATTGEAHWHVLLRARAIEAGVFVIAAAQTGRHEDGRSTYGHSLVIDPWGEVLLDMGTEPGVALCEIDMARVADVRETGRAHVCTPVTNAQLACRLLLVIQITSSDKLPIYLPQLTKSD